MRLNRMLSRVLLCVLAIGLGLQACGRPAMRGTVAYPIFWPEGPPDHCRPTGGPLTLVANQTVTAICWFDGSPEMVRIDVGARTGRRGWPLPARTQTVWVRGASLVRGGALGILFTAPGPGSVQTWYAAIAGDSGWLVGPTTITEGRFFSLIGIASTDEGFEAVIAQYSDRSAPSATVFRITGGATLGQRAVSAPNTPSTPVAAVHRGGEWRLLDAASGRWLTLDGRGLEPAPASTSLGVVDTTALGVLSPWSFPHYSVEPDGSLRELGESSPPDHPRFDWHYLIGGSRLSRVPSMVVDGRLTQAAGPNVYSWSVDLMGTLTIWCDGVEVRRVQVPGQSQHLGAVVVTLPNGARSWVSIAGGLVIPL